MIVRRATTTATAAMIALFSAWSLTMMHTASGFTAAPAVNGKSNILSATTRTITTTTSNPMLHHQPTRQHLLSSPAILRPLRMAMNNEEEEDSHLHPLKAANSDKNTRKNKNNKSTTTSAAAAATALAAVLMLAPLSADAAMSGGRMGGSFSAPRSSSGGGSYSRVMPSRSSYSSGFSQGYSTGFGSGYYSRPAVTVAPIVTPYYGGGVGAMGYGSPMFFGGGFLNILVLALGAFAVLNAIPSILSSSTMEETSRSWSDDTTTTTSALGPGTTVAQVSVALQVPNRDDRRSILNVLHRLSQTAKTDSRVGIQNLTSQVALELLRQKSSIVSASTRSKHFSSRVKAERDYNQLSVKERSKFEQETVSKYGGVDYASSSSSSSLLPGSRSSDVDDHKATMAVVTIMLAIDGDSTKLGKIHSMSDVEEVLRKIASDAKVEDCLQSAEILWTPEDRAETLSLRDVVADYPELRTI